MPTIQHLFTYPFLYKERFRSLSMPGPGYEQVLNGGHGGSRTRVRNEEEDVCLFTSVLVHPFPADQTPCWGNLLCPPPENRIWVDIET